MFTRKAFFIFVLLSAMALTGCNLRTVIDAQDEAVGMSVEATVQAMLAEVPADEGDSNVVVADQQETVSVVVTEEPAVVVTEAPASEAPAVEAACTNIVVFVADLTIPDDTVIDPGGMFVKSWRLRNGGTCTWTSAYTLVFSHGDLMGAANMLPIPGMVVPGQTVDLAVNLTAPVAPGTYQGYWKLRSDAGLLFGLGGTSGFWVRIVVPEPEVAPEPVEEEDPPIFEGVFELQPMFFIFTSTGTNQTLLDDQCFDLDTGVIAGCANPIADFVYDVSFVFPSFKYYIRPRNGASFGYYGFEQPTGTDCQGHALDGSKQVIKSGYFCYQTTDGKYGYLKASGSSMVSTNFNWATYTFP